MGQTTNSAETRELLAAVCLLQERLPATRIPLHVAPALERTLAFQEEQESAARRSKRSSRSLGSRAVENSDSSEPLN